MNLHRELSALVLFLIIATRLLNVLTVVDTFVYN